MGFISRKPRTAREMQLQAVADRLNGLIDADQDAMLKLLFTRVRCNAELAGSEYWSVDETTFGIAGLINAVLGFPYGEYPRLTTECKLDADKRIIPGTIVYYVDIGIDEHQLREKALDLAADLTKEQYHDEMYDLLDLPQGEVELLEVALNDRGIGYDSSRCVAAQLERAFQKEGLIADYRSLVYDRETCDRELLPPLEDDPTLTEAEEFERQARRMATYMSRARYYEVMAKKLGVPDHDCRQLPMLLSLRGVEYDDRLVEKSRAEYLEKLRAKQCEQGLAYMGILDDDEDDDDY